MVARRILTTLRGTQIGLEDGGALILNFRNGTQVVLDENTAQYETDASGNVTGLVGPDGSSQRINFLSDTGFPNQIARPGFTPARVIATGEDGIAVANGWSVSNGVLALDAANARRAGTSALKATANAGAVDLTVRHQIASVAISDGFEFWVRTPKPTAGTVNVLVQWSATAPGANPPASAPAGGRQLFLNGTEYAQGIWTCIKAHPAFSHYGTGRPSGRAWYSTEALPSTVNYIDIVFQFSVDVPAGERDCWIDMVSVNGKTKPLVVVGFDGFYASTASVALPLFNKYGLKDYNSSSGNNIASNRSTCDALYAAGWDLIQQGQRLGNYGTDANAGSLAADVLTARAQFDAAGYARGRNIFTYPLNSRQPASDAVLSANGFKCAAATGDGCFAHSQLGAGGILAVGRNSLNNVTAAQAQAALDAAIGNGGHIWYYGHNLVGSITDVNTQMLTSEFTAFMAYLADKHFSGAVEVVTPSEFLARVYPA